MTIRIILLMIMQYTVNNSSIINEIRPDSVINLQ